MTDSNTDQFIIKTSKMIPINFIITQKRQSERLIIPTSFTSYVIKTRISSQQLLASVRTHCLRGYNKVQLLI